MSSIDALLAARDGQLVSVPAAALSPIRSPLDLVTERVLALDSDVSGPGTAPVHLRVWSGTGPEGRRVVVLLGALAGAPMPLEYAASVASRWLPAGVGASEVAWCRTGHDGPAGAEVPVVESVVLAWPALVTGFLDRLLRPGDRRSPVWLPAEPGALDFATLAGVVGAVIDCYPVGQYTAESVTAVLANGGHLGERTVPVPVVRDVDGVGPLCEAITRLDRHAAGQAEPDLQRREDAVQAARVLAEDLQARLGLGAAPQPATGAPPSGARWALEVHRFRPSPDQAALLARYASPQVHRRSEEATVESGATDAQGGPGEAALLDRLWEWAEDVGAHSTRPDPELESAVRRAARLVATDIAVAAGATGGMEEPRPAVEVRVYRAAGPVDRAFLAGLEPVEARESGSPRLARRARALEAALPPGDRPGLRYGFDPDGRLVAHRHLPPMPDRPAGPRDAGWFALEWPLRPAPAERAAVAVVADADPVGGERPVFLAGPGGVLTPLPASGHGALRPSWQFGPGAQTRALAGDIAALLTRPGRTASAARDDPWWLMSRAELESALADAPQGGGLRIELDGFRR